MENAQHTADSGCVRLAPVVILNGGLAYLSAILEKAKLEIADDGYMAEESRQKIFDAFCFWDCLFALTCLYSDPPESRNGRPVP